MSPTKLIPLTDAEIEALLAASRRPPCKPTDGPLSAERMALLSAELKLMEAVS
jgi:hypothetical protein